MKKLLTVALLIATISSCKKSTNSTTTPITSYCPTTTGSTWTYIMNSTDGKFNDSVFTFTATDSTTTIDNKQFTIFNSSSGGDLYYANTDTGFYRIGGSLLAGLGIPALTTFDELYFKGVAASDTSWTNSLTFPYNTAYGTLSITANLKYSLTATDTTATILSNTFNDIVVIHLSISSNLPVYGLTSLGWGDFYYSKSAGMVSFIINKTVPGQPTVTTTLYLKSYSIK